MSLYLRADAAGSAVVINRAAVVVLPFGVATTKRKVAVVCASSSIAALTNHGIEYLNVRCPLAASGVEPSAYQLLAASGSGGAYGA